MSAEKALSGISRDDVSVMLREAELKQKEREEKLMALLQATSDQLGVLQAEKEKEVKRSEEYSARIATEMKQERERSIKQVEEATRTQIQVIADAVAREKTRRISEELEKSRNEIAKVKAEALVKLANQKKAFEIQQAQKVEELKKEMSEMKTTRAQAKEALVNPRAPIPVAKKECFSYATSGICSKKGCVYKHTSDKFGEAVSMVNSESSASVAWITPLYSTGPKDFSPDFRVGGRV